jgi:glutamyl-tRNA reductase
VLENLAIVNLRHDARGSFPVALNGLEWRTCLRRVLFLNPSENKSLVDAAEKMAGAIDVYRGEDGLRFLLEVICGLKSPLVGETAVMGQFREFVAQTKFPNTAWGNSLKQIIAGVLVDAKRVRHDHLQGLGSQSYGSLVRHHVKGLPQVSVLGAGQLAREILPWLLGKTKVRLFYRNWERAKDLVNDYPEINLDQFSMSDAGWQYQDGGLVIAAPLQANDVENWVAQQQANFTVCLDLRGEAEIDPLSLPFPVIKLSELFAALRSDREKMGGRVAAARAEIASLTQRQTQQAQFRPFGWEDLCA